MSSLIISENLIVTAKCLATSATLDGDSWHTLNRRILDVMEKKGHVWKEAQPTDLIFGGRVYPVMSFQPAVDRTSVPLSSKVKQRLHLKTQSQIHQEAYFAGLASTVDEAPHKVTFVITYAEILGKGKGYILTIESEPAIVAKKRQLHRNKSIDDTAYKEIVAYNVSEVGKIMDSLAALVIEEPKVLKPRELSVIEPLVDSDYLNTLPNDVALCLSEADRCFLSGHYIACSVLLRKAIEVATNKKYYQLSKAKELYDDEGNEISLTKKLERLPEFIPQIRRDSKEITILKWFGDKAAHDPRISIDYDDIRNNVAPKMKAFLTNLNLT